MEEKQKMVEMMKDEHFDKIEEFAKLTRPLQEWMLKNYNIHSKIIIECNGATITSDEMFIPLSIRERNNGK